MKTNLERYFERIGYEGKPKSDLETLRELHKLHTRAIPFENLTPFLHQEVSLDRQSLYEKMIDGRRGGYCFEQNLLFADVLEELGFKVRGLGARVLWNQSEDLITRRSHMLLSVEADNELYLADVGFGGLTLTTPMRFITDLEQETTHEEFRIVKMNEDFKLQARIEGNWKALYRFDTQEQYLPDYEVANFYLYTHSSSLFRNTLIAAKPFRGGRYALSGRIFSTYPIGGDVERKHLSTVEEIKNVLVSNFGINLPNSSNLEARLKDLFVV